MGCGCTKISGNRIVEDCNCYQPVRKHSTKSLERTDAKNIYLLTNQLNNEVQHQQKLNEELKYLIKSLQLAKQEIENKKSRSLSMKYF